MTPAPAMQGSRGWVNCWRCLDEGFYEVARVRDGEYGVEWYCVRKPCRCRLAALSTTEGATS